MKNEVIIKDWAGNILFKGHYKDTKVTDILDINRCYCHSAIEIIDDCSKCDNTGYEGDLEVYWVDIEDKRNVYELINY